MPQQLLYTALAQCSPMYQRPFQRQTRKDAAAENKEVHVNVNSPEERLDYTLHLAMRNEEEYLYIEEQVGARVDTWHRPRDPAVRLDTVTRLPVRFQIKCTLIQPKERISKMVHCTPYDSAWAFKMRTGLEFDNLLLDDHTLCTAGQEVRNDESLAQVGVMPNSEVFLFPPPELTEEQQQEKLLAELTAAFGRAHTHELKGMMDAMRYS